VTSGGATSASATSGDVQGTNGTAAGNGAAHESNGNGARPGAGPHDMTLNTKTAR
jgi:hypothetical protein